MKMAVRAAFVLLVSLVGVTGLHAQATQQRLDGLGDPLPDGAIARLGSLRFKHAPSGDLTIDVALFSPTSNILASLVYGRGSLCLFDAASGKELRGPWKVSDRRFTAIVFSDDGHTLAAATASRELVLYDLDARTVVKTVAGLNVLETLARARESEEAKASLERLAQNASKEP
jgi:hypothetical protein